jgi:hypothetical protein
LIVVVEVVVDVLMVAAFAVLGGVAQLAIRTGLIIILVAALVSHTLRNDPIIRQGLLV